VVEAAILLEAGWRSLVDEVWAVVAAPERVRERLMAQRGMTAAEVEARVARQMPDAARRKAADVLIENQGNLEDLHKRVGELWQARIAR
jgi:dephospho-CoA kinase